MTLFCGSLWKNNNAGHYKHKKDCRGYKTAQRQAACIGGLVKKIAENGAKRPREYKGRPEKHGARYRGPKVCSNNKRHQRAENYCAT